MLFDESTLRKLNQLTLVASQLRSGVLKGERRSTKRGSSIEFADYRNYIPGDDLRRLDWNVYARLDQPFIKLLEEEEDLAVHALIDASQSMQWGEAENDKWRYVLQLTAALGAIALAAGDHFTVGILKRGGGLSQYGPARGQAHLTRLLHFLEQQQPHGVTDLDQSAREYLLQPRRAGLAFLLSDLFDPNGFESALSRLQGRGYEVVILHVLSPDEIEPPLTGDLRLVDVESGQAQEVSLDGGLRALYRRRLQAWQKAIRTHCHKRGARYLPLVTSTPWDKVVLYGMRQAGIVR